MSCVQHTDLPTAASALPCAGATWLPSLGGMRRRPRTTTSQRGLPRRACPAPCWWQRTASSSGCGRWGSTWTPLCSGMCGGAWPWQLTTPSSTTWPPRRCSPSRCLVVGGAGLAGFGWCACPPPCWLWLVHRPSCLPACLGGHHLVVGHHASLHPPGSASTVSAAVGTAYSPKGKGPLTEHMGGSLSACDHRRHRC